MTPEEAEAAARVAVFSLLAAELEAALDRYIAIVRAREAVRWRDYPELEAQLRRRIAAIEEAT